MCSSYYSPYMYSYLGPGYYPYYGGGYYGWVNVNPVPPINGGGTVEVPPAGRVIAGHGYTQIRNREPEPAPRIGSSSGNGSAAGWSGNNSGGGSVSSQGFSSGSSGSSGGSSSGGDSGARIAVPKGGGGQ
jgi:hypothetical protein